jgi:ankyrin repeat protein
VNPTEKLVAAVKADDITAAADCLERYPELRAHIDESLPGLSFDGTLLLTAVWRHSKPMIELLLANGANINQRSRWWAGGFGVLDHDDHGLADFLIERGAQVDLYAASRLGHVETARRLLAEKPDRVHARGGDGQTPLHVAANVEIASLLVDAGADIDARDVDHESTPAQYAIHDRQDVVRYLVAKGCTTDLLMAAALGDLDLVRQHLDRNPKSIEMTVSAVDFPMKNPHAGGTIYIWTLGGSKSVHTIARDFRHEDVFQLLINRSSHELAVAAACEVGDETLLRDLLNRGAIDAARLGNGLARRLVDAADRNDTNAVGLMLVADWPADATGKHGATALHFAAWHGNAPMVRALLTHDAPLERRDRDFNLTPLGWAFHGSLHGWNADRGDYAASVEALLDAGATAPSAPADSVNASAAVRTVLRQRIQAAACNSCDGDACEV